MSQREQKYDEMIQVLRMALVERRRSGISYREMLDRIIRQEMNKSFDQQNYIIMNGMGLLRRNLCTTNDEFRNEFLLRPINANNAMYPDGTNRRNHRMGLIEQLENEIPARTLYNDGGIDNDDNYTNHFRNCYPIGSQQQQRLHSHSREPDQVIVIRSDSEAESDSETISACCPRSVRERVQRLLVPKLKNRIRREMEPQLSDRIRREMMPQLTDQIRREMMPPLTDQIRREMMPQLTDQIRREMEPRSRDQIQREIMPQLRDQIQREMMPQLMDQSRREMEPQLRFQIRRELEPMRENIENEIREADEHIAWIDFLLYIIDDAEIDTTLDGAIAICEVCTSQCMNRRPIPLNCGHIFCGNCLRDWAFENRICPKCRTQIRFSHSVFKAYPSLQSNN